MVLQSTPELPLDLDRMAVVKDLCAAGATDETRYMTSRLIQSFLKETDDNTIATIRNLFRRSLEAEGGDENAAEGDAKKAAGEAEANAYRARLSSTSAGKLQAYSIKADIAPFTGCFVSQLPITVAMLRFSLKVAHLFNNGKSVEAAEFIHTGVFQLQEGFDFIQ